ncbi:MAG: type III secretion system cytoplasmic ring protein SctQ [Mailhella sp.]|nr:type III secretion system cytoplasmic ring protein SctQ [Mailhella sp.]
MRSAVLRALLTELADTLQQGLRVPVSIRSIRIESAVAEPSSLGLGVTARLSGTAGLPDQSLFLSLIPHSAEAAVALADAIRVLPRSNTPNFKGLQTLPLELAFESGYLFLNRNDAEALASGDVLIPEVWYSSENRTLLRLCRGGTPPLTAFCSFADGKAVLESPLSSEVEPDMPNEHNDIDIRLSFELDRTTITLGELSSLAPGYVFPLACDAQTPVTIRANGKAIARGRLVDMDGTLGVQISETL